MRPSVWDSSGDGFSVQFTYSARRSEKSQRLEVQSSRCRSVKVMVILLFASGSWRSSPPVTIGCGVNGVISCVCGNADGDLRGPRRVRHLGRGAPRGGVLDRRRARTDQVRVPAQEVAAVAASPESTRSAWGRTSRPHASDAGLERESRGLILTFHGAGGSPREGLFVFREAWEQPGLVLVAPGSLGSTWSALHDREDRDLETVNRALAETWRRCRIDPGESPSEGSPTARHMRSRSGSRTVASSARSWLSPRRLARRRASGNPVCSSHTEPVTTCSRTRGPASHRARPRGIGVPCHLPELRRWPRGTDEHLARGRPLVPAQVVAGVESRLLKWFAEHGRDLPWRRTRDPYAILVSEVMLQQTQVERVIPRYVAGSSAGRPSTSLAAAAPADVIREWQGLGYNRRALNLHRAAGASRPRLARRSHRASGRRPLHGGRDPLLRVRRGRAAGDVNVGRVLDGAPADRSARVRAGAHGSRRDGLPRSHPALRRRARSRASCPSRGIRDAPSRSKGRSRARSASVGRTRFAWSQRPAAAGELDAEAVRSLARDGLVGRRGRTRRPAGVRLPSAEHVRIHPSVTDLTHNGDVATVLVVDDEPIVREVVVRYLEREGYRDARGRRRRSARASCSRAPPDLVVLDVMLPGTDGLELCRWIRSRSELPVIMLTARGEEADRIVGLELGADDYVTKPFSPRELAARVRSVLRRAAPSERAAGAALVRRRRDRRTRRARCARTASSSR